ncbi:hypothetical protein CgunFtcFv8_013314 [Champsocephalus gunnari]|uniref:Uncharacterized protein n=1 Tax=Champsocephalus gunnari TaxID=52237 RepID=A0AAN8HYM3_CHAGU|nr:hypothetical protein CgunFtcFv8_013314 [Champsocephalus gunnari]
MTFSNGPKCDRAYENFIDQPNDPLYSWQELLASRDASHSTESPHPSFTALSHSYSTNLRPLPSSTSTERSFSFPSRCLCSSHRECEGSTLTFEVAQNWISSVILSPSPSWSAVHAVTN